MKRDNTSLCAVTLEVIDLRAATSGRSIASLDLYVSVLILRAAQRRPRTCGSSEPHTGKKLLLAAG